MDDLISRADVIDMVYGCEDEFGKDVVFRLADYIRQLLPSAQPEIIYCGECAKMKVDTVFHDCWCGETGKKVWINHYCGYAERKEDGNR